MGQITTINRLQWLLLAVGLVNLVQAEHSDEVKSLPGLNFKTNFRQYSGYVEALNGSFLHYWFFESQNKPSSDPVVLWLNGGPGCSSLIGALTEQGPFKVSSNGSLSLNPYAWNKRVNLIYLESPAGVGFSYNIHKQYKIGDKDTALNNFAALKNFFKKYSHLEENDFYITGESYAGFYVPTLSVLVLDNKFPKNFKAFAIGNGHLDSNLQGNSLLHFGYYHGLYDDKLWNHMLTNCCNGITNTRYCDFVNNSHHLCKEAVKLVHKKMYIPELNRYNIYSNCRVKKNNSSKLLIDSREFIDNKLIAESLNIDLEEYYDNNDGHEPPCQDHSDIIHWLGQESVRKALNINENSKKWSPCSLDVSTQYIRDYKTMAPQMKHLLNSGLKGLIYNGDIDSVCNYLGDKWFVEDLGYKMVQEYKPWLYEGQVGGMMKLYENLAFTTIRGSGHMVPTDKPGPALHMFHNFLDGNIFNKTQ